MTVSTPPAYGEVSLLEKLDLIPAVCQVLAFAIYTIITGPFRGSTGASAYGQHILRTTFRILFKRLTVAQLQYA